ncbi:NAD(P)H-dependent flavin oxidoreductase [Paraburkholderia oxyphila]|uniref:NAD(P)H-dependent flavin oxidoreductase n=1 Tax=Paraburkholderia oxyphila TaxID=614212 RepID=UPI000486660B|nr:nitronate monooxygenase family protein [Paraburkholderia oxyphila]
MSFIESLRGKLALPVIGAPMFIASDPDLVIAQCKAGIIGTMPSLSVRAEEDLGPALLRIRNELNEFQSAHPERPVAPYGVNIVVHQSNPRFEHDLDVCVQHRVPLIITSLGAARAVADRVHSYGGHVLHDVINLKHARKAIAEGVDGIIAVCCGAGGHAGALSPFALVRELRQEYAGPLILAGAVSDGAGILAALAMGADLAYMGTRFIATAESPSRQEYKQMLLESAADDIMYSNWLTGVYGNFLKPSFIKAGLDPHNLPPRHNSEVTVSSNKPKQWKDIWSAGQGVGVIKDVPTTAELVSRIKDEFQAARARLAAF